VRNLATLSTTIDFESLPFQNGVSYLKSNFNLLRFDDCSMSRPNLEQFGLRPFELAHLSVWDPLKRDENISLINNSAVHFLIVFKFGRLVHYKIPETEEL